MTTNWLVALLLTAMAASVTSSRRFGESGFDQVPTVFPALRSRSASRAAPHQASLPSRLRQADHHLTIVDAPFDHRPAVGSLGWNWLCMLAVGALTLGVPIPVVRRHNRRPRVSATGTAPAKLAWLVLSTLATTVSGNSYQIVQSGTCASAGGESISSGLAACTAAGAELSIAWRWNLEYDSPHVPSGCIVTSTGSALYFNPRASDKDCGTATSSTWHCVCRFTAAYSPSPPASPPRPPDYGCWRASALSESCDTRCASLGGCSEQDMFLHSDEIDSAAEVKVLFEGLTGQTCGSPTTMYTWDSVPLFYQGGNMHCAGKTGATSAADFDCGASNPVAKRLCWCSSCASPPPFQPGGVPPAPPPPSYVKLATDGRCQGWSIQKAGTTPGACQDLCDQSDKCGATTFMQSSADNCATRRPAKLPATRPAAPLAPPAPPLTVAPQQLA